MDIDFSNEFPLNSEITYLNHAAVSPLPKRTAEAIARFADEYATWGATRYTDWLATEATLREKLRTLINAPSGADIALLKNTSEALSVVAHGFPWQHGDNVVISNEEFPSNRVVWETLAHYGVTVREVPLSPPDAAESTLIDAIDEKTRILAVSAVQFASGLRIDLHKLGNFCNSNSIALCVDAIQAVGAIEQDVQNMHIDFLMADGHKWMLSPEGTALFYCSEHWRERLRLHQYGWHMRENAGDFDAHDWEPARSARRFECGSPNMLGIHALSASVDLMLEVGQTEIERRILERTRHLFNLINTRSDLECLTNQTADRYAGIVLFQSKNIDADSLFAQLRGQGIICALRGKGIRFSPHFYTPLEKLTHAVGLIPED